LLIEPSDLSGNAGGLELVIIFSVINLNGL